MTDKSEGLTLASKAAASRALINSAARSGSAWDTWGCLRRIRLVSRWRWRFRRILVMLACTLRKSADRSILIEDLVNGRIGKTSKRGSAGRGEVGAGAS